MPKPGSKRTRIIIGIVGAALGCYLLYTIFSAIDLQATVRTLSTLTVFSVALILLPAIVGSALDAIGWRKLLPTHVQYRAFWRIWRTRVASEAVVNVVPLGAVVSDPLKAWLLKRYFNISLACGSASVALRTFLLAESQSLIVVCTALAGFTWLSAFSDRLLHNPFLAWIALVLSVAAILAYAFLIVAASSGSLTKKLHAALLKIKITKLRAWLAKQELHFGELNSELATFSKERKGTLFSVVAIFVLLWSMEGVETYIILRLLGSPITFVRAYGIEAICSFIRSVAIILPSGLGAQDAGYLAFITGSGESQAVAAAFIVIKRLRQLLWIAAGGGLLLSFKKREGGLPVTI